MKCFELILLLYLAPISYCDEGNPRKTQREARGRSDPISLPGRSKRLPTTKEQFTVTDIDIRQYMNTSGYAMKKNDFEDLSSRTFSSLFDGTEPVDEQGPGYDATHDAWEAHFVRIWKGWTGNYWKPGDQSEKILSCYFIGITYKNAIQDIRDYYKIRYLYTNNLDYEMGYLIEEIIAHYQIVVELYHLMVRKYGSQRNRFFAPTSYMFYMYTNIFKQSTVIIHLCNMLHELEGKYAKPPDTVFQDYHIQSLSKQKESSLDGDASLARFNKMLQREEQRKQKEIKKERKKLFKQGLFMSTTRTKRPRKGPYELHYGWSIETW